MFAVIENLSFFCATATRKHLSGIAIISTIFLYWWAVCEYHDRSKKKKSATMFLKQLPSIHFEYRAMPASHARQKTAAADLTSHGHMVTWPWHQLHLSSHTIQTIMAAPPPAGSRSSWFGPIASLCAGSDEVCAGHIKRTRLFAASVNISMWLNSLGWRSSSQAVKCHTSCRVFLKSQSC